MDRSDGSNALSARKLFAQADRPLMLLLAAIVGLGLYNLASAGLPLGASLHVSHGAHVVAGLIVLLVVASFPYRNLEGLAYVIFAIVVMLLLLTMGFGKIVNGSRRWLVVGPINIQTSDLAKLAVIVVVARAFHLARWEGGLTLREIFRPLNISRPLLVVVAVLILAVFGEGVKPAKLEMKRGRKYRTVEKLGPKNPRVVVGSAEEEGVVRLARSGVAAHHAEIFRVGDSDYRLRNLAGEVGVTVNDEPVTEEVVLRHNDLVRFGTNQRAELRFSASLQRMYPVLPWLALLGAIWLFIAGFVQVKKGGWQGTDVVAPIDLVMIPCVLILVQPDLGTTLVVLLIAFSMILYVGLRPLSLLLLVTGGILFGGIAWVTLLKPYQKQRVLTFLNPSSDLAGAGYHQHQSLIAIGSGQMWGKGHGQGTQTQLSFLPEQQTDFIFSVWAEEQGFVGSLLLTALFCALILFALRIAFRARDRFGALLAVGATALIFWHTIINMLMVLQLAPVVGVPLPIWSNGGSFVMTAMVAFGLLFNVSMRRNLF